MGHALDMFSLLVIVFRFIIVHFFPLCFYCILLTGMPDDCTVIVAHVVGRAAEDVVDADNR